MSIFPSDHLILPLAGEPRSRGGAPVPRRSAQPSGPYTGSDAQGWEADALDMLNSELKATRLKSLWDAGKLSASQARRLIERLIVVGRSELRSIAGLLRNAKTTLGRWFDRTKKDVLGRHTAAALALIGMKELPPSDRENLAVEVNRQIGFLTKFKEAIRLGSQPLDGTILSRSAMYSDAAWSTSHNIWLYRMDREGYTEARRIRGVADSCNTCVREAEKGWTPIRSVVPIGQSECRGRCHCSIQVR